MYAGFSWFFDFLSLGIFQLHAKRLLEWKALASCVLSSSGLMPNE